MDRTDYAELALLLKGAEQALLQGNLNEVQHVSTTTFHVLAGFILDLQARLLGVEGVYPAAHKSLVATTEAIRGI